MPSLFFSQTELLASEIRSGEVCSGGFAHYVKEVENHIHLPYVDAFARALEIGIDAPDHNYTKDDKFTAAVASITRRIERLQFDNTLSDSTIYAFAYALRVLSLREEKNFFAIRKCLNGIIHERPDYIKRKSVDGSEELIERNHGRREVATIIANAICYNDVLKTLECKAEESYNAFLANFYPDRVEAKKHMALEEIERIGKILTAPQPEYLQGYAAAIRAQQSEYIASRFACV